MSLFDLTDKVALVTGATKGIGLGIAKGLAEQGAKVIVSSRDQAACDALAAELNKGREADPVAAGFACDMDSLDDIDRLAQFSSNVFGGLDILVANAARLSFSGPSATTPIDVFDKLLTTNIHHTFRLCQAVRPAIAARGGGSMVLIGSMSGHAASPKILAYAVSKSGVSHLARCLADEMAAEAIRVNCVAPGLIRSFSSQRLLDNEEAARAVVGGIPLQRPGEPEDVAGAVIYLTSRAGSYVTGETILVDGGRTKLSSPNAASPGSGLPPSMTRGAAAS